jgi:hypothetical protein
MEWIAAPNNSDFNGRIARSIFRRSKDHEMSVVRISLGRFEASHYEAVRQKLIESQTILMSAIKALKGNLAFYAAIDRENSVMSNVSVWETMADAKQLDTLQAMLDLAQSFTAAGVHFERPITNHETLWVV